MASSGKRKDKMIYDGFNTFWYKCDREDCGLQVVRPGHAECVHGEPCKDADAWMRKRFPDYYNATADVAALMPRK